MRSTSARIPRPAGSLLCTLAIALSGAACGDADSSEPGSAEPVGQELGGSVAPLAQCRDWNMATAAEKLATVEDIRSQVNRRDAGVQSSELSDDEALEVFDSGCAKPYADGFRLHVLYARAAAFKPLREIAEGG